MVSRLRDVHSIRFEIFIPTTYTIKGDPTEETQYVQFTEVTDYLETHLLGKYNGLGGYTISNPESSAPYAGSFQGDPLERNFTVIMVIPDDLLNDAQNDIKRMVGFFQQLYDQIQIFAYRHPVIVYQP